MIAIMYVRRSIGVGIRRGSVGMHTFASRLLLCTIVALLISGCGGSKVSETETEAKILLSVGQPQEALEKLDKTNTASGHFLKALALTRLDLPDPAGDQLQKALEKDPENPVYRAYQFGVKMQSGDKEAIEGLLKIYEANKSSAPISLFAASAYAKKNDADSALKAFKAGIALSQEAPEFLPQMLIFATHANLPQEAKAVMDKLNKLAPGDSSLARQRVLVLLLVHEYDEAIERARELDQAEKHSYATTLLYGRALAESPATPEREKALSELVQRDPTNVQLTVLFGTFLARANRLPEAVEFLNQSIEKQPVEARNLLIHAAINLPLTARNSELAYSQLQQLRSQIQQPLFITYYEGRVLYLRGDYQAAVATLAKVVEAGKDDSQGHRALAQEALSWMQVVQHDQKVAAGLQQAADSTVKDVSNSASKKPESPKKDSAKAPPKSDPASGASKKNT